MKWRNKKSGAVLNIVSGLTTDACVEFDCETNCPVCDNCTVRYAEDPVGTMVLLGWEPMEEANEMKEFTKADIKPGMMVVNREGSKYIVIPTNNGHMFFARECGFYCLHDLNESLEYMPSPDMSIDKVYGCPRMGCSLNRCMETECRELLWERKEVREMTIEEVEALVGCKVKIVGGEKE